VFSPDGSLLALRAGNSDVLLWDWKAGKELCTFKEERGLIQILGFTPDGKRLVVGTDHGTIHIREVVTGKEVLHLNDAGDLLALSPDGQTLVTGRGSDIRLRSALTGKESLRFASDHPGVLRALFSPDGRTLATLSYSDSVCLWEVVTGQLRRRYD